LGDNTLGDKFKITSFGESHGDVVGIVIDGVPAGLDMNMEFVQSELEKRRPGQSSTTTSRKEPDQAKILSGVFNNKTTGAPIALIIENSDVDSSKYEKFKDFLRPSQVDYSALKKYGGFADFRGSGRFSGRITAGFVMAGAIAKLVLKKHDIEIFAYASSIGEVVDDQKYQIDDVTKYLSLREKSPVRAINSAKAKKMEELIEQVKDQKDSIGGTIKCVVNNFPEGIGGPVFNSLESKLSKGIFSIPAVRGIEFGAGFKAAGMRGSEHNDPWIVKDGKVQTVKNDSGGIIGGISTGMPIEFNIVIKPTPTIGKPQKTVNIEKMENVEVEFTGRHDPCIVPRAVVVVEAICAVVLLDQLLIDGIIPSVLK
jgi:chorismate synthase